MVTDIKLICKKKYKVIDLLSNHVIIQKGEIIDALYDPDKKDLSYLVNGKTAMIMFFIEVSDVPKYFYTEKELRLQKLKAIKKKNIFKILRWR